MALIIADTFADSLGKLNNNEQSAAKQTAFDLQVNPDNPGLSFHRIDKSKDKYFWSVRVNRDIRIIVHKRGDSLLLAYVGHHDDAYKWAEKRRLEVHPRTGAAQIVVLRERIEDVVIRRTVDATLPSPPVLADESDDTLLDCGVPQDWLNELRGATEDTLLDICRFLPATASEAVLNLAVGIRPPPLSPAASEEDPFSHPDAKNQFFKLNDKDDLRRFVEARKEQISISVESAQRDVFSRFFQIPSPIERIRQARQDAVASGKSGLAFRKPRKGPTDEF